MSRDLAADRPRPSLLRSAAALTALAAVAQLVLGLIQALGRSSGTVLSAHEGLAMLLMVLTPLAAIAAFMWRRVSGNVGLLMHAVTVWLLAVVQYGLGEMMGRGDWVRTVHIVVGLAFTLAAVALATLAYRKPWGSSAAAPTAPGAQV